MLMIILGSIGSQGPGLEKYLGRTWQCLGHSYLAPGHLPEDLKTYLITFDYLYDVLLHLDTLRQYPPSEAQADMTISGYIPILLQLFFRVLLNGVRTLQINYRSI